MSEFFNPFEFNFDPAPGGEPNVSQWLKPPSTDWTSNLSFGNPGLPTGVKAGSNTPGSNGGNPINPFTPPAGQTQGPSLFDTSVANSGYNPTQYASQAGVNSVLNFLGPTASAGMTRNEGPNAGPPQSIVNWGGQNHNTGLVQNLINQFGPELAMQMMRDQSNFHAAGPAVNGIGPGNSWTLRNDPSSAAYDAKAPTSIPVAPRVSGAQPTPATSSNTSTPPPGGAPNWGAFAQQVQAQMNGYPSQLPPDHWSWNPALNPPANGQRPNWNPPQPATGGTPNWGQNDPERAAAEAAGFGDFYGMMFPQVEGFVPFANDPIQAARYAQYQQWAKARAGTPAPPDGNKSGAPSTNMPRPGVPPTATGAAAPAGQGQFGLPEFLTLMMLLMGGGGALGRQQSAAPSAAPRPNNRNPLWYSPYY
jgi:hypothetical protein